MQKIIILLLFVVLPAGAQSILTLQPGTSMGVTTGANLCVSVINGSGILYGGGTICGGLVAVEPAASNELPGTFNMSQNYPNPFNPVTKVNYQLPKAEYVNITLYDQLGREILQLFAGERQAGFYELTVDGTNLASGLYFCTLKAGEHSGVIKISLIK
mgnify:FL=1